MTTKLRSTPRTTTDRVAATRMTFTTHVVDVDIAALLEGIDVADGPVIVELRTPSGRSQRVTLRPNLLIPPHHTSGWGTCTSCGAVNIGLNTENHCEACR